MYQLYNVTLYRMVPAATAHSIIIIILLLPCASVPTNTVTHDNDVRDGVDVRRGIELKATQILY